MKTTHAACRFGAAALATVLGWALCAQDAPGPPPDGRRRIQPEQWRQGPGARVRREAPGRGEAWQHPAEGREMIERFREENPEEFERLMQLRETEPAEFRRELRKLMVNRQERIQRGPSAEEEKCQELSRLYHEAGTDEERARIKAELRAAVEAAFDRRLELHRARLQRTERELERIREYMGQREQNRDAICEARLEELTRDPALNWEPAPR